MRPIQFTLLQTLAGSFVLGVVLGLFQLNRDSLQLQTKLQECRDELGKLELEQLIQHNKLVSVMSDNSRLHERLSYDRGLTAIYYAQTSEQQREALLRFLIRIAHHTGWEWLETMLYVWRWRLRAGFR